jgi:hypothetical protein
LILHLLTDEAELFDLRTDPYEMTNRLDDPDYAGVRRSLAARLDAWRRGVPGR